MQSGRWETSRPATGLNRELPPSQDIGRKTDDGFVKLFNGNDLSGWKTHPSQPGNWRVINGVLINSGTG